MTPKEKASELVEKFLSYVDWNDLVDDCTNRKWAIRNAKQCALICVDEMLNTLKSVCILHCQDDNIDDLISELEQVKQEIVKL